MVWSLSGLQLAVTWHGLAVWLLVLIALCATVLLLWQPVVTWITSRFITCSSVRLSVLPAGAPLASASWACSLR